MAGYRKKYPPLLKTNLVLYDKNPLLRDKNPCPLLQ